MEALNALVSAQGVKSYIIAMAVATARMGGVVLVMPAFTRLGVTGLMRSGITVVLALPVLPLIVPTVAADTMGFGQFAAILIKEASVGVLLGIFLGLPIWAAEAAGEILDLQRGLSFAELIDPSFTTQNNVLGTFFALIMVALYFLGGGFTIMLRSVYESYSLWPLASFMPMFSAEGGELLLGILDDIIGLGLMLVAPVVLALLLADLSLALVARAAPHMNVFVLSLPVKNFALTLILVLYGAFLIGYLKDGMSSLLEARSKLELIAPKPK
jgi:type III secretion protein T